MTPTGYFRKVEALLALMREHAPLCDLQMSADGQAIQKKLDAAADAVDQAWSEMGKADQLMVYNIARHLCDNIQPASPQKKPESSLILLN